MNILELILTSLFVISIVCLAAYTEYEEKIPGDWRKWGFDSDPLEPTPTPSEELCVR